jgi:hypothetical protein
VGVMRKARVRAKGGGWSEQGRLWPCSHCGMCHRESRGMAVPVAESRVAREAVGLAAWLASSSRGSGTLAAFWTWHLRFGAAIAAVPAWGHAPNHASHLLSDERPMTFGELMLGRGCMHSRTQNSDYARALERPARTAPSRRRACHRAVALVFFVRCKEGCVAWAPRT